MFAGWLLIVVSLVYIAVLFAIAWRGDSQAKRHGPGRRRPIVYSLALAVYCTSWTFYGAVGEAATAGWSFASIFVGPILTFLLFWPVLAKMIRVAKRQNVTSIADFIASRYGKTQSLAAFASLVALIGTLPYIALQLKAVASAFTVLTDSADVTRAPVLGDTAFYIAAVMALFAILFGTRHTDATEHHEGLIHAIAFESLVKLVAFLVLGIYVTWGMFDGLGDLFGRADTYLELQRQLTEQDFGHGFWAQTLLAMLAIFCLPRQFHLAVVENTHADDAKRARWLFPLYLAAIGFFVLPIAAAGLTLFPEGNVDPDTFVLALPMAGGSEWLGLLTFIGGLSAATGMVIMAAVAVSIMISNEIIIPLLFRLRWFVTEGDYGKLVLRARRATIVVILLLAYIFYRLIAEYSTLASTGMLSFAAAAQFAPALLGGLYWKRGNRLGVIAGMNVGFAVWAYTLLLPALVQAELLPMTWLTSGPLGLDWLAPTHLFGLNVGDSFTHGVMLSLGLNLFCYIFVSQITPQRVVERIQASLFVDSIETRQTSVNRPWTGATTVGDLKVLCERFLGSGQVQRSFDDYARRGGQSVDDNTRASIDVIQFTERLLASVLGASSARIVVNSALQGRGIGISDVISIVDEASQVLEFNRALLQATIENINQGISVVDQNARLVVWNQRYLELFRFPDSLIRVNAPFDKILRYNAHNGEYGPGDPEEHVELLMDNIRQGQPHRYVRYRQDGTVLEVQGNPMPGGGFVYTYQDITQQKRTEEALIRSENNIRIYTDNVPALIAYFDKECRYLFTNRAYESAMGIDRNEAIGERFDNVMPSQVIRERAPWMHRALAGERVSFEISQDDGDGGVRYMLVTYTPHFGEGDGVLGFFALYQDITERRLAEIALRETNENLEERVRERTQALSEANAALRQENRVRAEAESALRQAKQVAEEANASKTRFLAAASHDLLQPLNAARLFTSALGQQVDADDLRHTISHIDNSLQAAEELLSTLLDISKLDAGALTPRRTQFPLTDILRPLRAEFEVMAADRGLDLDVVATGAWVDSDAQMLRRIVQNFLSNALRYTQQGRVLLGCRRQGDNLSIEVWDTGPGIPEAKQAEIFQEFRRLDQASRHKESEKGLGLGLSIADRMSRVLEHPIKIRSWVDIGTVFSVSVPRVAGRLEEKGVDETPTRRPGNKLAGAKVLCIDNETLILEGMKAMLEGWDCEVFTATSIGGAKSVLRHLDGDPDAILADYHLDNEVTGLMALEALEELCHGPVPGIVITADRTDEVAEEVRRNGYQLLLKPVRPAALRALLTRTLQANRAMRQEH
ncbi:MULTISPECIES: hybrid sensor histidine kinase/response regulator [Chromohalobacter]|uniref:histidine kinase n=1 Tax=Chromohalobacter israelensis (strain ATCC BAA-138 / DSM 3043 / CIP 106854 / NCIMB 13768 / 1H11) TaxID=290398 RepID=Q1QZ82_CHRI1|nr:MULTISPECIES: NahK/ErcS family hybrid sensor histidine kinase/response regulator [Chromohalobacter]ABE58226.1 multi-sensor hybrid histidine kinase [Chromohalobacter salexigens DSM 3043]MBZ5875710.1 PAS-domain containing protein [Chromohalobacter salexigens]MDO0944300.1 NahK/ErcS family hybrid sensor histidine kinase/response regulator [Chromohalobacter salexigens]NQY45879.1 PAS-domain containing protein [Chromohalobacter sp.]NWO55895.1 PAS domain S-box protein [Chromohalobacter salexigens]